MKRSFTAILIWYSFAALFVNGCATMRQGKYIKSGDEQHAHYFTPIEAALLPVVEVSDEPEKEYTFRIFKDPLVNAWSLGGRRLVFTTALLDEFNHDELTSVCAHEVGHELLHHNGKKRALSVGVSGLFQVANIFVPGVVFADLIANPLITRGYSKKQEIAADNMAIILLERIGYSADDYIRLLERVSEFAGEKKQGGLLDEHPSIQDRIVHIKEHFG